MPMAGTQRGVESYREPGWSGGTLPREVEDLSQGKVFAILVPPLLFTLVARVEVDLGAIGQPMLDLYHISNATLRTVHTPPLFLPGLSLPEFRVFIGQLAHVPRPPPSILRPVRIPVRTVRTPGTGGFAAPDPLAAQAHVLTWSNRSGGLETRTGENHKTLQLVRIEFLHRVQQVAIDGHYATSRGANRRTVVR